jgi:hypothetical protein
MRERAAGRPEGPAPTAFEFVHICQSKSRFGMCLFRWRTLSLKLRSKSTAMITTGSMEDFFMVKNVEKILKKV